VALQVFIAAALAALWRTRRLGPLVAEPLPVVVRASETVEGHGRLYRSRRSRGRAAAVLRDAARQPDHGPPRAPADADAAAVGAAVAALTGREPGAVQPSCTGRPPATMRHSSRWGRILTLSRERYARSDRRIPGRGHRRTGALEAVRAEVGKAIIGQEPVLTGW